MLSPRPPLRQERLEILVAVAHQALTWVKANHRILIGSQDRQALPTFDVDSPAEVADVVWIG
jgi:hypothetical protein